MTVLIEAHYLPCIAYFSVLANADNLTLEKHENFEKQTYRNRCQLVTSQGIQNLIVPLIHSPGKTLVTDVRIDYHQKWVNNHWRTIQSAYGKAPFFEYYQDDLRKVFDKRPEFLYDFNTELLSLCLDWLKSKVVVNETLSYQSFTDESVKDYRSCINVKNRANMADFYQPIPYTQVFGNTFAANMSIIDLIFCVGPEAARIIKTSSATN